MVRYSPLQRPKSLRPAGRQPDSREPKSLQLVALHRQYVQYCSSTHTVVLPKLIYFKISNICSVSWYIISSLHLMLISTPTLLPESLWCIFTICNHKKKKSKLQSLSLEFTYFITGCVHTFPAAHSKIRLDFSDVPFCTVLPLVVSLRVSPVTTVWLRCSLDRGCLSLLFRYG